MYTLYSPGVGVHGQELSHPAVQAAEDGAARGAARGRQNHPGGPPPDLAEPVPGQGRCRPHPDTRG